MELQYHSVGCFIVVQSLADTRQSYGESIKAAEAAEGKYTRLHDRFDEVSRYASFNGKGGFFGC